MKERPILFSSPMVCAILDDRKTQTRRIIKNIGIVPGIGEVLNGSDDAKEWPDFCPYGKQGDRLWVRETFNINDDGHYIYAADLNDAGVTKWAAKWKPSIHMPRLASRITLEITGIRIDRLQDISEEDAIAEGISRVPFRPCDGWPICDGYMVGKDDGVSGLKHKAKVAYQELWESINGKGSWDLNPFVWVVEFKVLEIKK